MTRQGPGRCDTSRPSCSIPGGPGRLPVPARIGRQHLGGAAHGALHLHQRGLQLRHRGAQPLVLPVSNGG